MHQFNWRDRWWFDGMSLLSFSYHFARANKLRASELFELLKRNTKGRPKNAGELIDPGASGLNLRAFAEHLGATASRADDLFVTAHMISDADAEMRDG